jgi:hypothetical protein
MAHLRRLACATVVALAGMQPAAHAAGWQPAGVVSDPIGTQDTLLVGAAADRTGELTLVYRGLDIDDEMGPLRFRDRPFGGPIGNVMTFTQQVRDARLAVAPSGRQLLAYVSRRDEDSYAVEAMSRRRPDGSWRPPDVVAEGLKEPFDLQAALAPSGEAVLSWQDGTELSVAARTAAGARFGDPLAVGTATAPGSALAIDGKGNSLLAWSEMGDGSERVMRRPAGGDFGGLQVLPIPGRAAVQGYRPELAVTSAGRAVLAWYDQPAGATDRVYGAEAAVGTTSAGFGSARQLSLGPVDSLDSALDGRLTAVTWAHDPQGSSGRMFGAFSRTGKPVGALEERVLSPGPVFAVFGYLGVARGRATITWSRQVGRRSDGGGRFVVEARSAVEGGHSLTPRQRLSGPGGCCSQLALSHRGRPYLAWYASKRGRIDVARARLRDGHFGKPHRIRAGEFDEISLVPLRGDSMLLAYRRQAYHLFTYGERSRP